MGWGRGYNLRNAPAPRRRWEGFDNLHSYLQLLGCHLVYVVGTTTLGNRPCGSIEECDRLRCAVGEESGQAAIDAVA
ncbi:hypothetical protein ABIE13_004356 [Ottowia thiooxydans]|uniref:Uncharacterized protein n=1 Tax=Ottowia thiooxydans TaxID=219182 RepID=A0ABV2QDX5_9BURK